MIGRKVTILILLLAGVELLCLPKEYLSGLGYTPLDKLQKGEEWLFCSKYFTESGLCVDESTIKDTMETQQKNLLESQFKSMSGFDRIIPKMYTSIKSIRERMQNLYKKKMTELSKINNFSQRLWELVEKNKTSGHIIKEIAYFQMTDFLSEATIAVNGTFGYDDYQAQQNELSESANHTPDFENWSQHNQRLTVIANDIIDKVTKLQQVRYTIRGKIFRNEAKINALVSKNEIVPGFPLKGAPDLTVVTTTPTTEENTDTTNPPAAGRLLTAASQNTKPR
jgi:hypothetical protein